MGIFLGRNSELKFLALPGRESANPFSSFDLPTSANVSLRIVNLSFDPNRNSHVHPRSVEVSYVSKGAGTLWIAGERFRIEEGDSFLIPLGIAHATIPDQGTPMQLICFFPVSDFATNIEEIAGRVLDK